MARFNIMTTVQLAIHNQRYAEALADLLHQDASRLVALVDKPDLRVNGIIVIDGSRAENLVLLQNEPERFVVITRKDAALLSRIWDAGVRHVVFEDDSPSTAVLAVIAAELRIPHMRGGKSSAALVNNHQRHLLPAFPIPILDQPANACSCSARTRKTIF